MDYISYFVLSDSDSWELWSHDDFFSYVFYELPKDTHVKLFFIHDDLIGIFYYVNKKLVAFSVLSVII